MNKHQKVVWSEGMLLIPQHFQYWDRYHEALLSTRLGSLSPFGWGVAELEIDRDGLANGTVSLLGFRGVMPDGLLVEVPDPDHAPETRPVGDVFPPSLDHLDVYLGIPVDRSDAANCQLDETATSRTTRYTAAYVKMSDQNTGGNVREIAVARKNLRLFFTGEETTEHVTLKIAELVRTAGGNIALRDTYIPPSLAVSASPYMMRLARGLLEVLSAKSSSLAVQQKGGNSASTDPASFLLLHTVNAFIPLVAHVCQVGRVHPESLYLTLVRLAAEVSAFSPENHPRDLPPYQHTDLSKTFSLLEQKIRAMVEGVTPIRHTVIPLEKSRENTLVGRISDDRLLGASQLYLSVSGEMSEDQIREWVPRRVKVGSSGDLEVIIATAMPGIRL
ncbi:MAG TPA: type VI secretion system baseplate subunit TssK, partial [Nitrospiria bacterium]|nr:type VI secretion system baseplate subunit TssK [Nitrospiria bacterium]